MFLAISFIVAQNWKTPKGSLKSEQVGNNDREVYNKARWVVLMSAVHNEFQYNHLWSKRGQVECDSVYVNTKYSHVHSGRNTWCLSVDSRG